MAHQRVEEGPELNTTDACRGVAAGGKGRQHASAEMISEHQHQVIIVGGGPAGCTCALALHALGVQDLLVLEAGEHQSQRIGESVPPDLGPLLARCGILDAFLAEQHQVCVGSCSVWGREQPGYSDYIASPHGPGWHLDRRRFERFLAGQLRQRGIALHCRTRFRDIQPVADGFRLSVDSVQGPCHLQARWVLDAGGMQALLATRLGARKRIHDQLLAACAFLDSPAEQGLKQLTLLEAVEYGWWYAARTGNGRSIVAVASDADTLKSRQLNTLAGWQQHLLQTRHLASALATATLAEPELHVVLAASTLLQPCSGPGWLAIGDAASCHDPISAQGIHKAVLSALLAAEAIVATERGDETALQAYQQQIRQQFREYLRARRHFYALETRWPQSRFWRQRQQAHPHAQRRRAGKPV